MGFGTTVDVVFRLVFIMIVPYVMNSNPGLGMGPRFGFVMAVFAGVSIVFVYLLMPETMGKQLEEMDELFAVSTPALPTPCPRLIGTDEIVAVAMAQGRHNWCRTPSRGSSPERYRKVWR